LPLRPAPTIPQSWYVQRLADGRSIEASMGWYAQERAGQRIAELASQGLDTASFFAEAGALLRRAVPAAGPPSWATLDPATLLVTSYLDEEMALDGGNGSWEYLHDAVLLFSSVAHSAEGVLDLQQVLDSDHPLSAHKDKMLACGLEQAVIVALRSRSGATWGSVDLSRTSQQAPFNRGELKFLRAVSPHLAEGARRGLLVGEALDPEGPDAPGLVVLDQAFRVESLSPGVERWLAELPGSWATQGSLPTAVAAVASRAMRSAEGHDEPGEVAMARVLSEAGRWIVLHGAALVTNGRQRVAVIVEPAHPARISALLMAAYELTEREQEVTRHVLRGDSTADIADALDVSPQTVQQHLKSIFEKTGVRSRRELVGKVFFAHYQPRVADNDQRISADRPIRGGPWPAPPASEAPGPGSRPR
jgi:DNA-binding CsgD family transcriptional regulator